MFEPIREQIKTKLSNISEIGQVIDYPTLEFTSYPAVLVITASNDSEFQTNVENKRTYIFKLFCVSKIEGVGEQLARRMIEGLVDKVLNEFDSDPMLSGAILPNYMTIIDSSPALSDIFTDTNWIVAEMELRVVVQFNREVYP